MPRICVRLIGSTLLLPIALVGGLLTFPTICGCGEALPHDHALYILAGHNHAEDDALRDQDLATQDIPAARAQGTAVEPPTTSVRGEGHGALLPVMTVALAVREPASPNADSFPADGRYPAPDHPPPQA